MPRLQFVTDLDASQECVWEFHSTLDALEALTPPGTKIELPDPRPALELGARVAIVVTQPPVPFPLRWESVMTVWEPPLRFVDEQGRFGPWKTWHHEHRFDDLGGGRTRLTDTIDYEPPFGPLGKIADALFLRRQITAGFTYRHAKTRELLESNPRSE